MQQTYGDLTISDVLNDPLILAVSHADGISTAEFRTLLYSAAEKLGSKAAHRTTHYASVPAISGPKRKLHAIVNPLSVLQDNQCASAACY